MQRRVALAAGVLLVAGLVVVGYVAYETCEYSKRPLDKGTFDQLRLDSSEEEVEALIGRPPCPRRVLGDEAELFNLGTPLPGKDFSQLRIVRMDDAVVLFTRPDGDGTVQEVVWEIGERYLFAQFTDGRLSYATVRSVSSAEPWLQRQLRRFWP